VLAAVDSKAGRQAGALESLTPESLILNE